jgi:hypothetical protein
MTDGAAASGPHKETPMSSVSSISAGSSQLIQQLRSQVQSGGAPPRPTAQQRAEFESKFQSAAQDTGLDLSSFADIQDKIQTAVQDKVSSSNGQLSKDDLESTINGVLEENGIDAEEFKSKLGQVFDKMGMPKPGEGGFGGPGGIGGGFGGAGSIDSSQQDLINQLFGGDDESEDQSESTSISDYFRNLPKGSLVDANA